MTPMFLDLKMNFLDEIAISLYQKLFTNALFGHTRLIKPLFFIHCPTNSFLPASTPPPVFYLLPCQLLMLPTQNAGQKYLP